MGRLLIACTFLLSSSLFAYGGESATAPSTQSSIFDENPPAAPATQIAIKDNPAVAKAMAEEDKAIKTADADYADRIKPIGALRVRRLDIARTACIAALRRAAAECNRLKKTDEALAIKRQADVIQSQLGSPNDSALPNGGWTVLFRSADPSIWDTKSNSSPNSFAMELSDAPPGVQFLKIARPSRECVIIPMDNAHLGTFETTKDFGWDGGNTNDKKAYHLGVLGRDLDRAQGCVDVTVQYNGIAGWGFGNHNGLDDTQGFGWDGEEIGTTVFEISVKASPLTDAEARDLKQ